MLYHCQLGSFVGEREWTFLCETYRECFSLTGVFVLIIPAKSDKFDLLPKCGNLRHVISPKLYVHFRIRFRRIKPINPYKVLFALKEIYTGV